MIHRHRERERENEKEMCPALERKQIDRAHGKKKKKDFITLAPCWTGFSVLEIARQRMRQYESQD
jgi:hypothetical protein